MTLTASNDDGTVTVASDGVTLLRYQAETAASKPHIDRLALPPSAGETSGRNLVLTSPYDHQWHLGLFFCQKLVDGINCWESELFESQDRPHGVAEHVNHDVRESEGSVTITQNASWRTDVGEALLVDTRQIIVHKPTDGSYLLTWDQELEAVDERRHLSSETLHGHYSGLSARFTRSMADGEANLPETNSEEAAETTGPRRAWCDYSGGIDGRVGSTDRWTAGVTLMNHLENDGHPIRWFTAGDLGFVSANPTFETDLILPAGESVSWQWGAWVHEGTPDRSEIETAYEEFVEER